MLNAVKHLYGNNNFAILLSLREIRMTALYGTRSKLRSYKTKQLRDCFVPRNDRLFMCRHTSGSWYPDRLNILKL